jgi:hypothetical protein
MHASRVHTSICGLVAFLIPLSSAADQIVCTADGQGNDSCDITLPNVLSATTDYPNLSFQPGDTVVVSDMGGCVQTGGSGRTWKLYQGPEDMNPDDPYQGKIWIPGATSAPVAIKTVLNKTLTSTGGVLTLGYQDDDYNDNGYWSHDDGTDDQCADTSGFNGGRAWLHLEIHRVAQILPAGSVYGQCAKSDATHETCRIDRPDVTNPSEQFPSVRFCAGDHVVVHAHGCVQTGGSGRTWKDYVDQKSQLYHGLINIPGSTPGPAGTLVEIGSVVEHTDLPASLGGVLTLGYRDDDYTDNGYWSHDDGTDDQCKDPATASVTIDITHPSPTPTGCGAIYPVTGTTAETEAAVQSETAATVVTRPGGRRIVVAFNDQTNHGDTIRYAPSARAVFPGASLMGWAYSDDDGEQWTYGGRVSAGADFPILWGDPAIAAVPDGSGTVFLSNLALPSALAPPTGQQVTAAFGACIAKSVDGGTSFKIHQCVSNTDPPNQTTGHSYDGASLAATASGAIFAAYEDFAIHRIEVWSAPNANASFVRIAQPFPTMQPFTHPRLRAADDGSIYAASVFEGTSSDGSSDLYVFINRYANGAWGTPQRASEPQVLSGVPVMNMHSTVLGSPLTVRMAPQFSFDVGPASAGGQDAVRIMSTHSDAMGRFFIEGSACAADLSGCHPVPEWSVGPTIKGRFTLQAFDPVVRAAAGTRIGKYPARTPSAWLTTYYLMGGSTSTTLRTAHMYLNYMNGVPVGQSIAAPDLLTVCSDTRLNGGLPSGYWGDYNEMVPLTRRYGAPSFVSFITRDQQFGCTQRWMFDGEHQHVAAARWDP